MAAPTQTDFASAGSLNVVKCGFTYWWFSKCNHTIRVPRHRREDFIENDENDESGGKMKKVERLICNDTCKFDHSERGHQYYERKREVCSRCDEGDESISLEGRGIGVFFNHHQPGPKFDDPNVSNIVSHCRKERNGTRFTRFDNRSDEEYRAEIWRPAREHAKLQYEELRRLRQPPPASATIPAWRTALTVREERRTRFNDRQARRKLRQTRRRFRYMRDIHRDQRRAFHRRGGPKPLQHRPYILGNPVHLDSNSDFLLPLYDDDIPEGECTLCHWPFRHFPNDVLKIMHLSDPQLAHRSKGIITHPGFQPEPSVRMPCGHVFHFECISKHFWHRTTENFNGQENQCPVCTLVFTDVRTVPDFEGTKDRVFDGDADAASSTLTGSSAGGDGGDGNAGARRDPYPESETSSDSSDSSSESESENDDDDDRGRRVPTGSRSKAELSALRPAPFSQAPHSPALSTTTRTEETKIPGPAPFPNIYIRTIHFILAFAPSWSLPTVQHFYADHNSTLSAWPPSPGMGVEEAAAVEKLYKQGLEEYWAAIKGAGPAAERFARRELEGMQKGEVGNGMVWSNGQGEAVASAFDDMDLWVGVTRHPWPLRNATSPRSPHAALYAPHPAGHWRSLVSASPTTMNPSPYSSISTFSPAMTNSSSYYQHPPPAPYTGHFPQFIHPLYAPHHQQPLTSFHTHARTHTQTHSPTLANSALFPSSTSHTPALRHIPGRPALHLPLVSISTSTAPDGTITKRTTCDFLDSLPPYAAHHLAPTLAAQQADEYWGAVRAEGVEEFVRTEVRAWNDRPHGVPGIGSLYPFPWSPGFAPGSGSASGFGQGHGNGVVPALPVSPHQAGPLSPADLGRARAEWDHFQTGAGARSVSFVDGGERETRVEMEAASEEEEKREEVLRNIRNKYGSVGKVGKVRKGGKRGGKRGGKTGNGGAGKKKPLVKTLVKKARPKTKVKKAPAPKKTTAPKEIRTAPSPKWKVAANDGDKPKIAEVRKRVENGDSNDGVAARVKRRNRGGVVV